MMSKKFKSIRLWEDMAKSFHVTSSRSRAHKDKYNKVSELIIRRGVYLSVLDLGCGSGILEKTLFEAGFKGKVSGLDASPAMIEIASTINKDNSSIFEVIDINNWAPKDKFDVVVAINIMFLLNDKGAFLSKISDSMKADSVFILINPKPDEVTSNMEFIKEHFRDLNLFGVIRVFLNELVNIPYYIKMASKQSKLRGMAKRGLIKFELPEQISKMAKKSNLVIIESEDIHARQNWLFVMRRAK